MRAVDLNERAIFLEAIEIKSKVRRKEFLQHACNGNKNLRERVERLIHLSSDDDFILDRPIGIDSSGEIFIQADELSDLTGARLDKYHLVRKIGTGGMGDVYLAEQREPIRRRLAVKVIKLGLDTRNFVKRFNGERQILTLMDHEGITKVFDAGCTKSGRPYFVMELVAGKAITKFCDEDKLNVEQRLRTFLRLCDAISHAHQKGVIHRDLKPSNILVSVKDGHFFPKVIDFGVSKATTERIPGQTELTRIACMIGTPDYMSPEQADAQSNDQDVRTDIYSLGAILYELLTGTAPFELDKLKNRNLKTIREVIQFQSPQTPSSRAKNQVDINPKIFNDRGSDSKQLVGALKGNLDAIVSKCLEKNRANRYANVSELSADINLHLNGELLPGNNFGPVFRWFRFYRQNRTLVLGVSLLVLFLVSITIFSLISATQAQHYANLAKTAELLSKQRLSEANQARRNSQFAISRNETNQKQAAATIAQLVDNNITVKAIARFNAGIKPESAAANSVDSDLNFTVSNWLASKFSSDVRDLFTVPQDLKNNIAQQDGDIRFLLLLLQGQREVFGNHDSRLARTLEMLSEKCLSSSKYELAVLYGKECLFLHTKDSPHSEARVRVSILLAKSLLKERRITEARSNLKACKTIVKNNPRFKKFESQLDSILARSTR